MPERKVVESGLVCSGAVLPKAPPDPDQPEICVFGRGFGECIVVHVGSGRWIVVDSFRDKSKRPVAETYLDTLHGEHVVAAVVLTHWDDDHTKGASDLIERYDPPEVWMPAVLDNDEAFEFAAAHASVEATRSVPSGLREFVSVVTGLRAGVTRYALPGRTVATGTNAVVRVLSPHDEIAKQGFAALGIVQQPGFGEISSPRPNNTSIVLRVEMAGGVGLLGADLENSEWGWQSIVAGHGDGPEAGIFKVPHHGSPNAHSADVYERLCCDEVVAAVTRFTPGVTPRPAPADVARLRSVCAAGWICGAEGPRRRRVVEAEEIHEISLTVDGLWPFQGEVGMVRLRHARGSGWTAAPFGACEEL